MQLQNKLSKFTKDYYNLFITKIVILAIIIFLTRVIFQFPIEILNLTSLNRNVITEMFSIIDLVKILLFTAVFYTLYNKDKITKLKHKLKPNYKYLAIGLLAIIPYYLTRYWSNTTNLNPIITRLLILLTLGASIAFYTLGIFNLRYLKKLSTKRDLIIYPIGIIILYNILIIFQNQWAFFSGIIAYILFLILRISYPIQFEYTGVPVLAVNDFVVSIGAPCSGIDSMFLFIAFFIGLFAIDNKILKRKYWIFFAIGLVGVYMVNILRLYLLMLVGIHISPEIAQGLFHTNAGWLFFIAYFLIYYAVIKKYIYKK